MKLLTSDNFKYIKCVGNSVRVIADFSGNFILISYLTILFETIHKKIITKIYFSVLYHWSHILISNFLIFARNTKKYLNFENIYF